MRQLYGYYRSSAAFRVRIALGLKALDYEHISVNLVPGVSEHKSPDYMRKNPQGRVPYFIDGDTAIGQSLAIIEYLDEQYPEPKLLPADAAERARVRQLAGIVACDIHPLNNLSVLQKLRENGDVNEMVINEWYHHWVLQGFDVLEAMLARDDATGTFCHGDTPTIADICLIPQIWNARRFNVPLDRFPTLLRIDEKCRAIAAFEAAAPENQPDTPKQANA